MGKREDNKRIKALQKEVNDVFKSAMRGTGWKTKSHTAFRCVNDNFYETAITAGVDIIETEAHIRIYGRAYAKPMGLIQFIGTLLNSLTIKRNLYPFGRGLHLK